LIPLFVCPRFPAFQEDVAAGGETADECRMLTGSRRDFENGSQSAANSCVIVDDQNIFAHNKPSIPGKDYAMVSMHVSSGNQLFRVKRRARLHYSI
jgi:hypothetical protein